MRSDIDLGLTGERPALLDLTELLATRLLVQGNSGSGKSHLLRRLLEQSAGLVQQAIIDPEGDFASLADRYGHVVVEADGDDVALQRIAARVRTHRVSVVLSLENLDADGQMRAAAAFLGGLFDADRDHWYPMLVAVDEAQLFAPAAAGEVSDEARRLSLGAMTNLMCRGRKRGLAGIIATQRLAKLAKNVAAEASNFLMGRTFLDIDMARAADLLGLERRQAETFRDLPRGHFVALGPALSRRPLTIAVGPTQTVSRSSSPVLVPLPDALEDARALILTASPEEIVAPLAPRPKPRPTPAPDVLVQLANYRPPVPAEEPEEEPMDPEAREAALAEVLASVLADADAAACTPATLYQDFTVRCRIRRLRGDTMGLPEFKRRLAVARAEAGGAVADNSGWEQAQAIAASLPDDLAGLFLVVARAAIEGAPCPTDTMLAEAYGTSSGGRARRMLAYLEERGAIVTRKDLRGAPIIAVPDLGVETGPGEPQMLPGGTEAAGGLAGAGSRPNARLSRAPRRGEAARGAAGRCASARADRRGRPVRRPGPSPAWRVPPRPAARSRPSGRPAADLPTGPHARSAGRRWRAAPAVRRGHREAPPSVGRDHREGRGRAGPSAAAAPGVYRPRTGEAGPRPARPASRRLPAHRPPSREPGPHRG